MRVGIDSIIIKRFQKLKKFDLFLNTNFTEYEIHYINAKNKHKFETMAGLFAAKEAFLKALQKGLFQGLFLKDIEIRHKENGAPFIYLNDKVLNALEEEQIKKIEISITHTKKTAIAICIIE